MPQKTSNSNNKRNDPLADGPLSDDIRAKYRLLTSDYNKQNKNDIRQLLQRQTNMNDLCFLIDGKCRTQSKMSDNNTCSVCDRPRGCVCTGTNVPPSNNGRCTACNLPNTCARASGMRRNRTGGDDSVGGEDDEVNENKPKNSADRPKRNTKKNNNQHDDDDENLLLEENNNNNNSGDDDDDDDNNDPKTTAKKGRPLTKIPETPPTASSFPKTRNYVSKKQVAELTTTLYEGLQKNNFSSVVAEIKKLNNDQERKEKIPFFVQTSFVDIVGSEANKTEALETLSTDFSPYLKSRLLSASHGWKKGWNARNPSKKDFDKETGKDGERIISQNEKDFCTDRGNALGLQCLICGEFFFHTPKGDKSRLIPEHKEKCQKKLETGEIDTVNLTATSISHPAMEAIIRDFFVLGSVNASQISKLVKVLNHRLPHIFKNAGQKYVNNAAMYIHKQILLKEEQDFYKFLKELLKDERLLTICMDGGTLEGVHVTAFSLLYDGKTFILKPVVHQKPPTASDIVKALKDTVDSIGKTKDDVAFMVSDGAKVNSKALAILNKQQKQFDEGETSTAPTQVAVDSASQQQQQQQFSITVNESAELTVTATIFEALGGTDAAHEEGVDWEAEGHLVNPPVDPSLAKAIGDFSKGLGAKPGEIPIIYPVTCLGHYFNLVISWVYKEILNSPQHKRMFHLLQEFKSAFEGMFYNSPTRLHRYKLHLQDLRDNEPQLSDRLKKISDLMDTIDVTDYDDEDDVKNTLDLIWQDRESVLSSNFKDEKDFRQHVAQMVTEDGTSSNMMTMMMMPSSKYVGYQQKLSSLLEESKTNIQDNIASLKHSDRAPKLGCATRFGTKLVGSVEHLQQHLRAIFDFTLDEIKYFKTVLPSMQKIIEVSKQHEALLKQCWLYLVAVAPAAAGLREYSDPTNRGRADSVFSNLEKINKKYDKIRSLCETLSDKRSALNDKSSILELPQNERVKLTEEATFLCEQLKRDMPVNEDLADKVLSDDTLIKDLVVLCKKFSERLGPGQWDDYVGNKCPDYHNNLLWKFANLLSAKQIQIAVMSDGEKKTEHINNFSSALHELQKLSSARMSEIEQQVKDEYKNLVNNKLFKNGRFSNILLQCRNKVSEGGTMIFWKFVEDNKVELDAAHLSEVARAVLNVPPVVTSVDTFFSVAGCLTDRHRLTSHQHVILQAFLHANGDWRRENPYFPWSFCDARKASDRMAELEQANKNVAAK